MMGYGKRILLVDDEEGVRNVIACILEEAGFSVVPACDGLQALREMQKRRFDAVITDFQMPALNGIEFLTQSRAAWPDTPVIIVSGTQCDMSEMAAAQGAFAWIRKSSDSGFLLSMLALAVDQGVGWESKHAMQRVGA